MIRGKLSTLLRLPLRRRLLMVEAALWLLIARIWLLAVPFRRVAPRLGQTLAGDSGAEAKAGPEAFLAREIGWAVTRAADNVPFRAVCLQQAVAAKLMLRRRGVNSLLSFGVTLKAKDSPGISAHAWLDAEGVKVVGYPVPSTFARVACFY